MAQFIYKLRPTRLAMLTEGPTQREAAVVAEHFAYLQGLLASGTLLMAGRTRNAEERTFGIAVLQAENEAEALQHMQADPAVRAGVMQAELFSFGVALWSPHGPQGPDAA